MSTILFDKIVFGPIHSRRLGVSLGMNLLPTDGKLCSFNCIYCECGLNENHRTHSKLPTRTEVREALEQKLSSMKAEGIGSGCNYIRRKRRAYDTPGIRWNH